MLEGKRISVIIPAAGSGSRMGGPRSKQFIELQGKPILLHTLNRFQSSPEVDEIIVATAKDHLSVVQEIVTANNLTKVKCVVLGGAERQDSVLNGLQRATGDIVLVHDGVRPFVSRENIRNVTVAALRDGAAILAVQPKDTIKVSDGTNGILSTPDRKNLWIAQTPQAFSRSVLIEAFKQAQTDGFYGTDEAMLVERIGVKVHIVEGNYDNLKITTPEDLDTAERILQRMR